MTTLPPTPIPDNRKLVTNETAKLFANNLDRASTACFTVGAATPVTGWLFGVSGLNQVPWWFLAVIVSCWLGGSALLHYLARRALRGLIP